MQDTYRVTWVIDVAHASSPKEAAEIALEIMRDPESIALAFMVENERGMSTTIDLWTEEEPGG